MWGGVSFHKYSRLKGVIFPGGKNKRRRTVSITEKKNWIKRYSYLSPSRRQWEILSRKKARRTRIVHGGGGSMKKKAKSGWGGKGKGR